MAYRQLTQEQRYAIYTLRKEGFSQRRIARCVGVHPSTISRELRRNVNRRGYRPKMAHRLAMARRKRRRREPILQGSRRVQIRHYLRRGWSPEQIAGRLAREGKLQISYQTIYRYIQADRRAGGHLYERLRRKGRPYRPKGSGCGPIRNRRFIEERPPEVEQRRQIGHWELDTLVSPDRTAIVTMVERVSQLVLLKKVPAKNSLQVAHALVRKLGLIRDRVHTLTSDNGAEFAAHGYVAKALGAEFFFARPHKPWQRALNEKTNGLVREFFPKGMPLGKIPPAEIQRVARELNTRPRKTLNYLTPNEVFYQNVALDL